MNAAKRARSEKDLYIELRKMKQLIETGRAKDLTEWWGKQKGKMPTVCVSATTISRVIALGPVASTPEVVRVRKIVVYELLSLDGVAEDPDKFITDWDDVMDANMAAVIDTQDTVILGRRSYDEWARFWPESTIEPFATFINAVAKFVVTSTPLDREWADTRVVEGGLTEFVRELQDQPGRDIGVHASISVAQALLSAGVVDELKLVIAPTIAGSGRRLLDGVPAQRLESIRSVTSPTGHLLADYRVVR